MLLGFGKLPARILLENPNIVGVIKGKLYLRKVSTAVLKFMVKGISDRIEM